MGRWNHSGLIKRAKNWRDACQFLFFARCGNEICQAAIEFSTGYPQCAVGLWINSYMIVLVGIICIETMKGL